MFRRSARPASDHPAAGALQQRMADLRETLQTQIHELVGFGDGEIDFHRPHGDPGLFGPGSITWKVHGDFTAMMVGGVAALLMQMLHPSALAGVWDHSGFREDRIGRLRRTAQFIAGTTYASTTVAERLIAKVRAIHDRVHGTLPDGTPYSANDPELLGWVHVAEAICFLEAYLRYRDPLLAGAAQDRYFAESLTVAERLGARDLPTSRREVARYIARMRPALRYDDRTREVAAALLNEPTPGALNGTFRSLFLDAGTDLLPAWAAGMHGFDRGATRRRMTRAGVQGMGSVLRWALRK